MWTVRDTAHYLLDVFFFTASTEPRWLSARFLNDLTTVVAGSEEESGEQMAAKQVWDSTRSGISTG